MNAESIPDWLRRTIGEMGRTGMADVALWNEHSIACLSAIDEIEHLQEALAASTSKAEGAAEEALTLDEIVVWFNAWLKEPISGRERVIISEAINHAIKYPADVKRVSEDAKNWAAFHAAKARAAIAEQIEASKQRGEANPIPSEPNPDPPQGS